LDVDQRKESVGDYNNTNRQDVTIGNIVFMWYTFYNLKGVRIGENLIVGICSVVTKSISKNEFGVKIHQY